MGAIDWDRIEYFAICPATLMRMTPAAFLLDTNDGLCWMPKSQMHPDDVQEFHQHGPGYTMRECRVTPWIAEQKELSS